MDIICHNCQSKFKIADDKIPSGKTATFPCPKCKSKISIGPGNGIATGGGAAANGESYDAFDKPFDFIEEEGLTALVCEQNPLVRKTITDALQLLEYQITVAESARDALKR
ncbi:MAG: zinc-ribbon domain-containing protein, partial [Desulfobacterales bacterium]